MVFFHFLCIYLHLACRLQAFLLTYSFEYGGNRPEDSLISLGGLSDQMGPGRDIFI